MGGLPDPDWYFEHVLINALPGRGGRVVAGPVQQWRSWWAARAMDGDPVVAAAAAQGFVLTPAQVQRLGISRSTTRTRVHGGAWSAPAAGTIAPLDVEDGAEPAVLERRRHALLAAATALRNPGQVVSGRSAAILNGLPTMDVPGAAEVTSGARAGLGRRAGAHRYGAALTTDSIDRWFGVPVTTVERTVLDAVRHSRRDGLMAADAALHARLTTGAALDEECRTATGWPGVRQARELLALASPLAESALESLVRLAMYDAGLPAPELQVEIGDYRVDMCWPAKRLILEADGLAKYTADVLRAEKRRERRLQASGWRVERITWDEVVLRWPSTLVWLRPAVLT